MKYLIDTCVLSEWKTRKPDRKVLGWLRELTLADAYVSILTVGEIEKGILRLPASRRKDQLAAWLEEVERFFRGNIVGIARPEISAWASINASCEAKGRPIPIIDGLLAATAKVHGLAVASRNVADLHDTGVKVYNPWTGRLTD